MNNKVYNQFITELCARGLKPKQAKLVVDEYAEAEKVGQHSHGLSALPNLLKRLKEKKGPVKIIKNSGSTVFLDGNKELGQIAAEKAILMVAQKAKRYGIGLVGLPNILPFMRPGTYAKKLAKKNLIAIVTIDGGRPMVTHPDSPIPVIGTNPIAFGIPTVRGPWVVDMATSKRAWAEVRHALKQGIKLPPETYKDKRGRFTRDPKKAFSAVSLGGYKGFALGLFVEILCGSLLGEKMGKHKKAINHIASSRGAVFIAIDPARFGSLSKFKGEVAKFLKEIKSSKRNRGVTRIRVPGESSFRNQANEI